MDNNKMAFSEQQKTGEINSKGYWQTRFASGDWDKYDGDKQTAFFVQTAINAFPEWIKKELLENELTISDLGCAEGSGTALLAYNFPLCQVVGYDFSEAAVDLATKRHPNCQFVVGDITKEIKQADIVFCSNVIEHMQEPGKIMDSLLNATIRHAIIVLPFRDKLGHKEHFRSFDEHFFPLKTSKHYLSYFKIIDCSRDQSPYWPGEQIIAIYSDDEKYPQSKMHLSDHFINNEYAAAKARSLELQEQLNREGAKNSELQEQLHCEESKSSKLQDRLSIEETKGIELQGLLSAEEAKGIELQGQLSVEKTKSVELQEKLGREEAKSSELQEQLSREEAKGLALQDKLSREEAKGSALQEQLSCEEAKSSELQEKLNREEAKSSELQEKLNNNQALVRDLYKHSQDLDNTAKAELDSRMTLIKSSLDDVSHALSSATALLPSRSAKLSHFASRWRNQRKSDNKDERKAFWKWFRTRFVHKTMDTNHAYNPLYQIINPLKHSEEVLADYIRFAENTHVESIQAPAVSPCSTDISSSKISDTAETKGSERLTATRRDIIQCKDIENPYKKYDVIIFSVIDYDFRYQRPQQIADHFVREGHRVYYINANFSHEGMMKIHDRGGLRIVTIPNAHHNAVYSTDFTDDGVKLNEVLDKLVIQEGIRDGLLIADYPTWVSGMLYLKEKYGFVMATDYMDDYTGFLDTTESFVESACITLLENSDVVVASSSYLERAARRYNNNVIVVRNGTEFEHFHQSFGKKDGKQTIGYYGAIAHWFDLDKIKYLSERFPNVDIILIGDVTAGEKELRKLPNIKLLGEKAYKDLPELIVPFDVCLIPFDASTNLIQATNPVKFYEYLSAGKKIVATEIPELEPFRDKYVYLANDNKTFGDYVELCLKGEDLLASPEECARFAKENDWSERVKQFNIAVQEVFPKISIIVLCFNQLEYTQECVESILRNTAYPNYELILVDNHSTDQTADYLKGLDDPRIKIVLNETNRGFAGGNNDGIRVSDGDYIVLLNNDTVVTRGWLTNMVKKYREKHVGVVGPVTNSIGNEAMINLGYYKDIKKMPALAYDYTARHMGENYPNSGTLAMFCFMISRKVFEDVGELDENYGIGMFEDDDYCMAVRKAGYKVILAEDVFIHHYGNVSFKKLTDEKYRSIFEKNQSYYNTKWNTKWTMHHYRPGVKPEL